MSISFATDEQTNNWNDRISANPDGGNILQGKEFLEQKALAGWKPRYIMIDTRAIGVLEKTVPFFGKVWYAPKGPSTSSAADLRTLLDELIPFAKNNHVVSLKIEPELDYHTELHDSRLLPSTPVQYNYSTVLVDVSPSEEEILANLNQKGRHAIRRAERDGVTVQKVEVNDENCQLMYELFKETATGAGFVIRPASYYREFYDRYGENGGLFFAYYEGNVVAGAFAMVQGTKSMYKDGASVRERTAYGASHLLQWEVIKWVKSKGSKQHDLAGVPPIIQIKNPEHPFYGLGRFKTSFNKDVTQYVGAFNIAVAPVRGKLWQLIVEKLVRKLHFMTKHESFY